MTTKGKRGGGKAGAKAGSKAKKIQDESDYIESGDERKKKQKRKHNLDEEEEEEEGEEGDEKIEIFEKQLISLKQKLKEKQAEINKLEKTIKPKPKKNKKDEEESEDKVDVIAVGYRVDEGRPNSHLNGSFGIAIIEDMHGYGNGLSKDDASYFFF